MILTFGTTFRHNELLSSFFANIFEYRKENKLRAFQEQCALVYLGEKKVLSEISLVNATEIEKETLEYLDYVQPDFFLFKDNKYLINKNETKIAGIPDLIIEVWSERNTDLDKLFKHKLYSTGQEHWYLTQQSNKVECWYGTKQLSDQSLTQILRTQQGIEFDLRYLALDKQ